MVITMVIITVIITVIMVGQKPKQEILGGWTRKLTPQPMQEAKVMEVQKLSPVQKAQKLMEKDLMVLFQAQISKTMSQPKDPIGSIIVIPTEGKPQLPTTGEKK